jgi:hypothetical protein
VSAAVGRAILRAAPWPALLGGSVTATGVFVIAAVAGSGELVFPLSLLGLGVCGATAAYTLDEASPEVEDAAPRGRSVRVAWRLPLALLPFAVGCAAVLWLDTLDWVRGWDRLVPVAAGSVAVGLACAAALRRTGRFAPGDLAGALTFGLVVLAVAVEPLRAWVSLAPVGSRTYPRATALTWALVLLAAAALVAACERDPGRPSLWKETR